MLNRRALLLGAGASAALPAVVSARARRLLLPTVFELAQPQMAAIADDLWIARLTPHSWVTSFTHAMSGAIIPANGLIALTAAGPVLVDPGWSPEQANSLLAFTTARFGRPIGAIATHWHADRLAGIPAMRAAGIPIFLGARTQAVLAKRPLPAPDYTPIPAFGLEAYFPGAGHTPDNIVVWSPQDRILFGGCAIKSATAKNLGNLEDADRGAWPASMERLRARYPEAALVIPGHGAIGGDPIGRTLQLLRA